MGIEENKAVVRQFEERTGKGDTSALDELTTNNFVLHATGAGRDNDREAVKRNAAIVDSAASDTSATVEDIIAEGDKVAIRVTLRYKHTGKLRNVEPTGKDVTIARFRIFRLENGKIAELWNLNDRLGQFQQMGALPPTSELDTL